MFSFLRWGRAACFVRFGARGVMAGDILHWMDDSHNGNVHKWHKETGFGQENGIK